MKKENQIFNKSGGGSGLLLNNQNMKAYYLIEVGKGYEPVYEQLILNPMNEIFNTASIFRVNVALDHFKIIAITEQEYNELLDL